MAGGRASALFKSSRHETETVMSEWACQTQKFRITLLLWSMCHVYHSEAQNINTQE